jgi:hypothetical protein
MARSADALAGEGCNKPCRPGLDRGIVQSRLRQLFRNSIGPVESDGDWRPLGIAGDVLCWAAPSSIQQCHGSRDALAWASQRGDEGGDGIGGVLTSELLDIKRGSRSATWVAADASWKRPAWTAASFAG